jgi:hypothetical protein
MLKNLVILFFFISLAANAQDTINLNGVWRDSSGTSFSNCYAIITQNGNKITFSHYLEFNGQPFVEFGQGNLRRRTIKYKVKVTKQIEGWAVRGEHELTLSADGKTLRGTYRDGKGNTGPMVLKRMY